jgi:hypothetical protein
LFSFDSQGFGCLPCLLMLLLQQWVPESPKWLLLQSSSALKGDTISRMHTLGSEGNDSTLSGSSAANAVYQNEMYTKVAALLRTLRAPGHDVDGEISGILADAKAEAVDQEDGAEVTWAEVFAYKKGMVVGIGLMFFQVRKRCTFLYHPKCLGF